MTKEEAANVPDRVVYFKAEEKKCVRKISAFLLIPNHEYNF